MVVGIGLLGGVGAIARFLLDGAVARAGSAASFPFGTLAVNLTGSFAPRRARRRSRSATTRYASLGTGLLGAFTTFSTWALESHRLGEDGQLRLGALNFAVSLVLGVALAWARPRAGGGAVNDDCLKLTTYFGERDRAGGGFLADALHRRSTPATSCRPAW